ncbi:MAG: hypothetical protein ACKVQW_14485 [Pyrinomonadaceae bacterium]
MSNEDFLKGISLFREELTKVISHYKNVDSERGEIAYSRWSERFSQFLGSTLPQELQRWKVLFAVGFAVSRMRESKIDHFMRVYGKKTLAFMDDLEEEVKKGRIDLAKMELEKQKQLKKLIREVEQHKKQQQEWQEEEEAYLAKTGEPSEISESLKRFREDFPDNSKVGFLMMRFGTTPAHSNIVQAVQDTLKSHGLNAIRADHKEYHDDVYGNVETYLRGCGFGIAVFERLETNNFNPNVALEVGHMFAQSKKVCILKDKTLDTLPTDVIGKLYQPFDPQSPEESIPSVLSKWLKDKQIIL